MLRDSVAGYLGRSYDFEARRAAAESEAGWRPQVWRAFAEDLGILGAPFPENLGGLGGGAVETLIIMEEFGKALVLEPYVGAVVIGGGLLKNSAHPRAAELIAGIVSGDIIFAFAGPEPQGRHNLADVRTTAVKSGDGWTLNGTKAVVTGAPWASHLVVTARTSGAQRDRAGISAFIVPAKAAGVNLQEFPTVDGSRAAEVMLEDVKVAASDLIGVEGAGLPLVERAVDEAIVATCAEACGILKRLVDDTVEYAKQRKQFGQAIGQFQALQHRMVDMFIQLEQAVSITYLATIRLDDDAERAKAASAAKAQVGKAAKFVGQNAVQLHGGMGMTDELPIGWYFRRLTVLENQFGSTDHHLARYDRLAFGE